MSTQGRLKKTLIRSARRSFRREGARYLEVYLNMRQAKKLGIEPDRYIILIDTHAYDRELVAVMLYRNACTTQWSVLWRCRDEKTTL